MKISFKWKNKGYSQSLSKFRGLLWGVRPFLVVLLLFIIVRSFFFSLITLPNNQKAFVNMFAYGVHLPTESIFGNKRLGEHPPQKGDEVVFKLSNGKNSEEAIYSGKCITLAGENVWVDPLEQRFLPGKTSPDAHPICIPSKAQNVRITPFNIRLFAYLLSHYEACKHVQIISDNTLQVEGKTMHSVRFTHNYYWVEIMPKTFVIVPHDALIGKVVYNF